MARHLLTNIIDILSEPAGSEEKFKGRKPER